MYDTGFCLYPDLISEPPGSYISLPSLLARLFSWFNCEANRKNTSEMLEINLRGIDVVDMGRPLG